MREPAKGWRAYWKVSAPTFKDLNNQNIQLLPLLNKNSHQKSTTWVHQLLCVNWMPESLICSSSHFWLHCKDYQQPSNNQISTLPISHICTSSLCVYPALSVITEQLSNQKCSSYSRIDIFEVSHVTAYTLDMKTDPFYKRGNIILAATELFVPELDVFKTSQSLNRI